MDEDTMLIKTGLKHKKFLGIKRKIKAGDFHKTFGTVTTPVADFDLDSGLRSVPDQNNPDPIFGTPAQIEGCTGETLASVVGDLKKILFSPYYPYQQTCQAQGVPVGSPCQMDFVLNEPVISGQQAFGETQLQALNHKTLPWWEVTALNGSLFQGMVSAMQVGGASISYAGTWYESYESPDANYIVPLGMGETSGHNWKFSGVKTINGTQYLIARPWLGSNWGDAGKCYFSEAEINANGGQAFTPNESATTIPIPVSVEGILESLIHFIQALLLGTGSGGTVFTPWQEMEDEIQTISNQIPKTMENEVYAQAKASLGKHMTLDDAVPDEKGCAEAVSAVLALAGISDGSEGIAGTAQLYEFLVASPNFTKIDAPEAGAIICSPTRQGNGTIEGHVGFFGEFNTAFPNDWGILSNDSASGLFLERWNWTRWQAYYGVAGGLPLAIFRPV